MRLFLIDIWSVTHDTWGVQQNGAGTGAINTPELTPQSTPGGPLYCTSRFIHWPCTVQLFINEWMPFVPGRVVSEPGWGGDVREGRGGGATQRRQRRQWPSGRRLVQPATPVGPNHVHVPRNWVAWLRISSVNFSHPDVTLALCYGPVVNMSAAVEVNVYILHIRKCIPAKSPVIILVSSLLTIVRYYS